MLHAIPWASDLRSTADAFADLAAVHDGERDLSFRDLAARAAGVAHALRRRGIRPGQAVATSLRNSLEAVWASFGLRLAGAAETALNARLGAEERRYCLDLSGAGLVVTTRAEAPGFAALGREVLAVEDLADEPGDLLALPPVPGEAWGRISFTSGTTGRPKAIVQTHAGRYVANLLQRASLPHMPGPGSRVLLMTPYVHGASLLAQAFTDRGATAVLLDGVDIPRIRPILERQELDFVFAPPTVLAKLADAFEGRRFSRIRTIFCGTAPLTPALYARARAIFGPVVRVTYGKSEVTNPITALPPDALDAYYAATPEGEGVCVGWPGTGVEITIRDEAGADLPRGAVGEVHLRATHMLHGHIDAAGFHPVPEGGWHETGDLGRFDTEGRLHLVGRLADVIKSGGYKVHPDEVERALAASGGAAAVAVVSLPSEYWGEVIVAVAERPEAEWEAQARQGVAGLARYKHPRQFVAIGELPRNQQGKVVRRRIREFLLERYRLVDGPHPVLEPR